MRMATAGGMGPSRPTGEQPIGRSAPPDWVVIWVGVVTTSESLREKRIMEIVRNADGTLVVPVVPARRHDTDDDADTTPDGGDSEVTQAEVAPTTRVIHPGEGGYDEALAEWDLQQNPDRAPVVSTATGRQEAMALVHEVATSPDHAVAPAVAELDDPEASGEALRHVLVGGVHSVEAFAAEVAEAEGGEPLPPHQMTKIIGEVLAEFD
jgi:hypothetical protein